MDNKKTPSYYIDKMITDLSFIISHTSSITINEFEENEILIDSVMFRLIQISENCNKLPDSFKEQYPSIPWRAIKGLRNRIVHEYGNIDLSIIYKTVTQDIPCLLQNLEHLKNL